MGRKNLNALFEEKYNDIVDWRTSGMTYNKIAELIGCSNTTVRNYCIKNNIGENKNIIKLKKGMQFGEWTLLERDCNPTSKQHSTFWFCECGICKKIYSVSRDGLISGKSSCCNHCKGEKISNKLVDLGLVSYKSGDKYGKLTIIERGQQKSHHTYVKCKCDCGNIIEVRLEHLKGQGRSGSRTISCGCVKMSSGELKIKTLLENNGIEFAQQYRIKEFNISSPFDFAIFKEKQLLGLIEFDGEQHFRAVEYWGGEEQLKLQIERDKRKDDWCKENNIRLIRIPYTEYDNIDIGYLLSFFPELS